jgi:PAS domain-containing protein
MVPATSPARWLAAVADRLATPLLLLDAQGRLLHANEAAREWLAVQQRYQLGADGVLAPLDGRHRRSWHRLLVTVAMAPPLARTDDARWRAVPQLPGWRLRRLHGDDLAAPPRLALLRPLPEGE